jgi:ribosome-binding factor A
MLIEQMGYLAKCCSDNPINFSFFCKIKYSHKMESTRTEKIEKLLQRELGTIFQREAQMRAPGKLITITRVRISPDLSKAKVYMSVFPSSDATALVDDINMHSSIYRNMLAQKVRHQLRAIPELQFFNDDSEEYISKIDSLLK